MGKLIAFIGRAIQIPSVIIGTLLCAAVVFDKLGVILGWLSILFFPVAAALIPLYSAFADGYWIPLLLVYGGGFAGYLLVDFGKSMDRQD